MNERWPPTTRRCDCGECTDELIDAVRDATHALRLAADQTDLNIVRRQRLIHHNQTQVRQRLDRLARLGLPTPERDTMTRRPERVDRP